MPVGEMYARSWLHSYFLIDDLFLSQGDSGWR